MRTAGGIHQRPARRIRRRDAGTGDKPGTAGDGRFMEQRKQCRTLDTNAAQAATQRAVAYIQHSPPGVSRDTPQPRNRRAESFGAFLQPQLAEDDESGFLKHQTRTHRAGGFELIKHRDAVTLPRQQGSSRKAADPGAGDPDGKCSTHLPV